MRTESLTNLGSRRGGEEESVMNFVPGEEREGKMRIIHKEQVGVTTIIVESCINPVLKINDHATGGRRTKDILGGPKTLETKKLGSSKG